MFGTAYRAIRVKEDGSYETDGYLMMDRLYDGLCRIDSYGADLSSLGSSFRQEKNPFTDYGMGESYLDDDRSYVLMADTDMEDLLAIRRALNRLNRIEQREWGIESNGLDASIYVRSFSGGKVRIADYTRRGRLELHSKHSTLTRHFIGAANREGIHAITEEPRQMDEETYERMGRFLQEIAGKYGFQCGKEPSGSWYLGAQETDQTRQVFLRLKRERGMQDCLCLCENVQEILEDFIRRQDHFSQEDAWALADDLNGLCGRMTPPVIPMGGKAYGRNAKGIRIGALFSRKTLAELPHSEDGKKVLVWELKQAYLRGTSADLRDTMIGFLWNMDNAVNYPEAVAYLGEMIKRYRLDTVRELNGERLKKITKETLEKVKQQQGKNRIKREEKRPFISSTIIWHGTEQEESPFVAEKAIVYSNGRQREMAR